MVKHTQTIRLSVFDHLVGLALKGIKQNSDAVGSQLQIKTRV